NMAELLKIKSEVEEFKKEYFYRNSQAEENRQREYQAANRIQSWFRASKVRAYLSHLHKKAIIIQRIWRGFTARARFRQMVKAAYFIMKMNFYEEMAVRIQKRWRGFFVRKYIHNYYARKSYLEGLSRKNELVRMELAELEELQKRERDCVEMVKEQTAKVYQAHRLHHLLSTKQCPGVFNSPFRPAPHEMELLLRQVKYQAPARRKRVIILQSVILIIKDPQHPLLVPLDMALDESRDPLKLLLKKNDIIKTWQTALLGATAQSRLVSVFQ
uniref:Spermatogenesis associated 17 n=1 Tax=Sander lucioperca TaxID=283035 RepID=A0A8C9YCX5_SANLU